MLKAIKHGLTNLINGQGRDARQAFWFYILFVFLINFGIGMTVSIPMTMQAMMIGMQQGMAHPGDPVAAQAAVQAAMAQNMAAFMPALMWTSLASGLILLLATPAAVVRRLHDSGLSGWWVLIPVLCQVANLAGLPSQMAKMQEMMAAQLAYGSLGGLQHIGWGAVAGWGGILVVILLGVRKSTDGPNRYGEAPFVA